MQKNIVVFGATSAIAQEVIRLYAKRQCVLHLVARNEEKLNVLSQDARVRDAADIHTYIADLSDMNKHETLVSSILKNCEGHLDVALIAHGTLPDQKECESSWDTSMKSISDNGLSAMSLLHHLAPVFEKQQGGSMVAISSVAGDRGRQSNYVYGCAKGMLTTYMQGLRNRMAPFDVQVLTVKPGFVDTPMTAGFDKGPLWAKPQKVALDIVKAVDKKYHEIYTPFFWWGIMSLIKSIPEFIFKKLKL